MSMKINQDWDFGLGPVDLGKVPLLGFLGRGTGETSLNLQRKVPPPRKKARYSDISAAQTEDGIHAEITVQNTCERAGDEIVQRCFRDPVSQRVRPVRKLAAFEKAALQPGEIRRIAFDIPKYPQNGPGQL